MEDRKQHKVNIYIGRKNVKRWYAVRQQAQHASDVTFIKWLLDLAEDDISKRGAIFSANASEDVKMFEEDQEAPKEKVAQSHLDTQWEEIEPLKSRKNIEGDNKISKNQIVQVLGSIINSSADQQSVLQAENGDESIVSYIKVDVDSISECHGYPLPPPVGEKEHSSQDSESGMILNIKSEICEPEETSTEGEEKSISDNNQNVELEQKSMERKGTHVKGKKKCVCEFCGKKLSVTSALNNHIKIFHSNLPRKSELRRNEDWQEMPDNDNMDNREYAIQKRKINGKRMYRCKVCLREFADHKNARYHVNTVHLPQDKKHQFICEICAKLFYQDNALRQHRQHVHKINATIYKCKDCLYESASSQQLIHHRENRHQNSGIVYYCDKCDFNTKARNKLYRHKTFNHAKVGKESYPCTWPKCSKTFTRKDNLKVHMYIHTGQNPVKCVYCDFSCKQRASLTWHVGKYHAGLPSPRNDKFQYLPRTENPDVEGDSVPLSWPETGALRDNKHPVQAGVEKLKPNLMDIPDKSEAPVPWTDSSIMDDINDQEGHRDQEKVDMNISGE